jgi:hypothetical protein
MGEYVATHINTLCRENAEVLNVELSGTYSLL